MEPPHARARQIWVYGRKEDRVESCAKEGELLSADLARNIYAQSITLWSRSRKLNWPPSGKNISGSLDLELDRDDDLLFSPSFPRITNRVYKRTKQWR